MTQTPTDPTQAIEQLVTSVRTEAEKLVQPFVAQREEAVAETQAAVLRITVLEKQLEDAKPTPPRQALEINPTFNPDVHLDPMQRAVRIEILEWVDHMIRQNIEPLERGCKPGRINSQEPLLHGQMHAKHMRNVQHVLNPLAHMLERWGDPAAWERARYVIGVVWNPKRMATRYDPGAKPLVVQAWDSANNKVIQVSDEQPGLLRFNYQAVDEGTHSAGDNPDYVGTDMRHDLDYDLSIAGAATAKKLAKDNLSNGGEAVYKLVRRYTDDQLKRLKFWAFAKDGGALSQQSELTVKWSDGKVRRKWYVRGKQLRHPARARHYFHRLEFLDTGDVEQDEAARFYGSKLMEDTDYVNIEGTVCATYPHFTQALLVARGSSKGSWGHQDITYKREDAPLELMLYRLDDPFMSLEYLAASANTTHMVVFFDRPLSKSGAKISASLGGNGPETDNGKNVISYRGKTYPTKRMFQGRAHVVEDLFQATRGLNTIYSFAAGNPRYIQDFIDMNARTDSTEHKRFGARVALMEAFTPQRIDL